MNVSAFLLVMRVGADNVHIVPIKIQLEFIFLNLNFFPFHYILFVLNAVDNDDSLFLLATCYFRSGKPQSAYAVLSAKGCTTPRCRYLTAQCCVQLNR